MLPQNGRPAGNLAVHCKQSTGLLSLDLMPDGTPASRPPNEQATKGESDITFTYNDK